MNKIIIGLLLLFISSAGFSQETHTKKKKIRYRKQLNAITKVQINELKDGALLVRLKTKKNSIAALQKIGKNEAAEKLELKQAAYNLNIVTSFKKYFTFCPTYFFYSDYSTNIKEREFDKVLFLNEKLQADSSIKFVYKTFLTADFGTIEQDTVKYFANYSMEQDKNLGTQKVKTYNGGPDFGFDALIIRNDKFIQLRDPFPYFERTRDPMPNKRKLEKVIKKINKRFFKFYIKKNKKK